MTYPNKRCRMRKSCLGKKAINPLVHLICLCGTRPSFSYQLCAHRSPHETERRETTRLVPHHNKSEREEINVHVNWSQNSEKGRAKGKGNQFASPQCSADPLTNIWDQCHVPRGWGFVVRSSSQHAHNGRIVPHGAYLPLLFIRTETAPPSQLISIHHAMN